jgi:hypothetical protein
VCLASHGFDGLRRGSADGVVLLAADILFEVLSIPCFLFGAFEIGWLVLEDSLLTH